MEKISKPIEDMHVLFESSKSEKSNHLVSASKQKKISACLSLSIIVVNVIIGIILSGKGLSNNAKYVGVVLSIIAAFGTWVIYKLNFGNKFQVHRDLANKYAEFERRCESLLSNYYIGLVPMESLAAELPKLKKAFNRIDERIVAFPTSGSDKPGRNSRHIATARVLTRVI